MKNLARVICVILIVMTLSNITVADLSTIRDVNVVPENPLATDPITFNVFLRTGSSPGWVESEEYSQDGTSLQLNLNIDSGNFDTVCFWTYSKEIGTLEPGDYSLTVRALAPIRFGGWLLDTHTIEFTVTPEPATLVLLAIGVPVFRSLTSRRRVKAMAT